MSSDLIWFGILGLWAAVVVFGIKPFYHYLREQGSEHMVAVYYNRKVAHMLAGGVPIIASPMVFDNPIWVLIGGVLGSIALAATHVLDKRLWWMQTDQNMNDATFALMLGISVFVIWEYSDDCLLYTSPSPRDLSTSRMPSSA